jgi:nitroreductase/dihydropteridine reductase
MDILKSLEWRYATKRFDPTQKLAPEKFQTILKATNLTASSIGLQPFQILVVENPEIRQQLRDAAHGQPQLTEASHVVLFAAKSNLSLTDVEAYLQLVAKTRQITLESLTDYRKMLTHTIESRTPEALTQWAARQAYIALGTLLTVCAIEEVDACPMEGFDNAKYDEILGLKEKGLTSVVMATVGYRSADDKYQHLKKVRRDLDDIVTVIK